MSITGVVALMIMTVTFFGDMIAREQVAMRIADVFVAVADSPVNGVSHDQCLAIVPRYVH